MESRCSQHSNEAKKMVPVTEKSNYLQSFHDQPLLRCFISWLWDEAVPISDHLDNKNADDISILCMNSISRGDKNAFTEIYQIISKRKPNHDSDWIYNDILIFPIVCGVKKFGMPTEWIKNVVDARSTNDGESALVRQSYIDIINDSFQTKNCLFCMVIVAAHARDNYGINEDSINAAYIDLSRKPFPYHKSHFLNIVALRSIDLMFLYKGMADTAKIEESVKFCETFENKVHTISKYLGVYGTVITITVASLLIAKWGLSVEGKSYEVISRVTSILFPLIGCSGIVSIVRFRTKVVEFLEKRIFHFWGYPK